MPGALSRHTPHDPPQTAPILGRESEMVRNDAGGHVFTKDVWTRLYDFLVLGTEGGTYYADERTHTYRNIASVNAALTEDGPRAVALAVEISAARPARAPRNHPALYVVAAALAAADLDTRRAAADAVPRVARTTDHLAHLFGYFKALKGKPGGGGVGRAASSSPVVQRAWTNWYRAQAPDRVAYQILKGRQRKTGDGEQFRPGDLLRLARPKPVNEVEDALFRLAVGKAAPIDVSGYFASAKAYYEAQLADTPAKAVRAILAYHVPWEFLRPEVLAAPDVWEALVPTIGMTALIRNLARMTTNGALGPFRQSNARVAARLCDQAALHSARIHPFDLMLARLVYASGAAQPDPRAPRRTWDPVPEVVDALDRAYALSFGVAEKTRGRVVIGIDRSGSMAARVRHGGSDLGSAYHVASAVAQTLLHTWTDTWTLEFDDNYHASRLRRDASLGEIFSLRHGGGGTDVSAPIRWALDNRIEADVFAIVTDNETWAGQRHTTRVLEDYRRVVNPAARVVVVSTTAAGYSVADPKDEGVLNVAGFDSALPTIVAGFASPAVQAAR